MNDSSDCERSSSSSSSDCHSSYSCSSPFNQRREFEMTSRNGGTMDAGIGECRDFYNRRMQNLERFRLNCQEMANKEATRGVELPDTAIILMRLQSDMASLFESDVSLTQQLLALGERIAELKAITSTKKDSYAKCDGEGVSAASSTVSLDDVHDEDRANVESDDVTLLTVAPLAAYTSDDSDGHEDELESNHAADQALYAVPQKQYFSRQNSVLRIPIPPSRRRSSAASRRRSCVSVIQRGSDGSASTTSSSDGDRPGSYVSWYNRKKASFDYVDRVRMSAELITPELQHLHASQGSCDSGVHHLNNADLLDAEDTVFV